MVLPDGAAQVAVENAGQLAIIANTPTILMTVKNLFRLMIPSDSLRPVFREAARASRLLCLVCRGSLRRFIVIRSTSIACVERVPLAPMATTHLAPGEVPPKGREGQGIEPGVIGALRLAVSASEPRRKHESPDSLIESGADPRSFDRNGPILVSPYLPHRPHTAGIG